MPQAHRAYVSSFRYFAACAGSWEGPYDASYDPTALRTARLGAGDRWAIRALDAWPWRLRLATSVDVARIDEGIVVHTTWLGSGPVACFRSTEVLQLDPDGTHLTLRIDARWATGRRAALHASGQASPDGMSVSYAIPWMGGATLRQVGRRIDANVVTLTQDTPWSAQVQVLQRRPLSQEAAGHA